MARIGVFPLLIGGEYDRQPVPDLAEAKYEIVFWSHRNNPLDRAYCSIDDSPRPPLSQGYDYEIYRPEQLAINGRVYIVWAERHTPPSEIQAKLLGFLMDLYAK